MEILREFLFFFFFTLNTLKEFEFEFIKKNIYRKN